MSSKPNNSDKKKWDAFNILYFILLIIVSLILLSSLLISIFCNKGIVDASVETSFNLILTSLAIMFASSIIFPKVMLKQEVENAVKQEIENIIKKELKAELENDLNKEIWKTDAHLSRMVAFFLAHKNDKEYPIWAIGWCFRSLKRYQKLEIYDIIKYNDFLGNIKYILWKALKAFASSVCKSILPDDDKEKYLNTFADAVCEEIIKQNFDSNEDEFGIMLRAIKDVIDFDFYIFLQNKNRDNEKLLEDYMSISSEIAVFIKILLATYLLKKKNEDNTSNYMLLKKKRCISTLLTEKLLEISVYGNKNLSTYKQFSSKLEGLIKELNNKEEQKKLITIFEKIYSEDESPENELTKKELTKDQFILINYGNESSSQP